jgi:hypothetical protein
MVIIGSHAGAICTLGRDLRLRRSALGGELRGAAIYVLRRSALGGELHGVAISRRLPSSLSAHDGHLAGVPPGSPCRLSHHSASASAPGSRR